MPGAFSVSMKYTSNRWPNNSRLNICSVLYFMQNSSRDHQWSKFAVRRAFYMSNSNSVSSFSA